MDQTIKKVEKSKSTPKEKVVATQKEVFTPKEEIVTKKVETKKIETEDCPTCPKKYGTIEFHY